MTKEMFEEITAWQREIFTKATALSAAIHLKEESFELVEAIENYAPGKRIDHEYADVLLLAFGSASLYGFTYEDVCRIINEKMEINKRRQWGKVNEQGYVKHVDESPSSPSEDKGGEEKVWNGLPDCPLSNAELIEKSQKWISKLCKTGGKAWSLRVPVDLENDPDILFSELCKRLSTLPSPAPVKGVEEAAKEWAKINDEQVFSFTQELRNAFKAGASFHQSLLSQEEQDGLWEKFFGQINSGAKSAKLKQQYHLIKR